MSQSAFRGTMQGMSVPPAKPVQHPAVQGFDRIARDAERRFRGRNLRVRRSSIVHAVGWYAWIGDLTLPGPACRTGWAGVGALGEFHAVDAWQPVTCRKCGARQAADVDGLASESAVQLELLTPGAPGGST